jgi:uncharacterized SAM-binding protein YcdF (DUF218 family)
MVFSRYVLLSVLLVALLALCPLLTHYVDGNLTMKSPPAKQKMDAVLVFSGSSNRLVEGYDYFLQGKTKKLMITGNDYPRIAADGAVKKLLRKVKKHKDQIYIDLLARNTIENAENGAQWALKNHVKNILLITTEGHMPRAYFELRRLLPDDVKVYTKTVPGNRGRYAGVDTEKSRLLCRMYETATKTDFCYQARDIIRTIDKKIL